MPPNSIDELLGCPKVNQKASCNDDDGGGGSGDDNDGGGGDDIKVLVVPDDDENIFLSSSDENDDIDDNNLLDFLMTYNKLKHRNKQKKEGKFLPLLKNFLKASIEHKKEIYERNEKRLTARFRYVAKNILDKKIPVDLTHSEKHVLQKLVNKYKNSIEKFYSSKTSIYIPYSKELFAC